MIEINIDPVAFRIGSIEVGWYGIMIALGVIVLILWTIWQVRKGANISYETVLTAALVGIPAGVIFSRLLHVIDRWGYYVHHPGQIIGGEGLTIYGAVLGAALAIWIYSRFSRFRFTYAADLVAPGIVLAQAIGRVGCLINGCCYGTETSLPWAISYTHPNNNSFGISGVHPTQVYEIIFLLILFGILIVLKKRLKHEGSLFLVYLGGYSLWRFSIGFIRDGTDFLFGLHQAQVIGIIVVAIIVALLIRQRAFFVRDNGDKSIIEEAEVAENGKKE
jgi:phosphatidylglycerol:prolipoprotein diacylglycerol transferase